MICSANANNLESVRDYFFGELSAADRVETLRHLTQCGECSAELARLQTVEASLAAFHDEEPPRRIGFVSDKVFEPSPVRRWWSAFWLSGARLGFAGAAVLSAALVFSATRPQPIQTAPRLQAAAAPVDVQAVVNQAVSQAVARAITETTAAQDRKTLELVTASERKHELQERALNLRLETSFDLFQKRYLTNRAIAMNYNEAAQ